MMGEPTSSITQFLNKFLQGNFQEHYSFIIGIEFSKHLIPSWKLNI